jgi:hypothetical protein
MLFIEVDPELLWVLHYSRRSALLISINLGCLEPDDCRGLKADPKFRQERQRGAGAAFQCGVRLRVQKQKADSTLRSSRAVPHPSTDRALRRLTSEVGRDPVHSTRYGRQRNLCFTKRTRNLVSMS